MKSIFEHNPDVICLVSNLNLNNDVELDILKQLYNSVIDGNIGQVLTGIGAIMVSAINTIARKKDIHNNMSINELIDRGRMATHEIIVSELITRKIMAEFQYNDGCTLLHLAAELEYEEVVIL